MTESKKKRVESRLFAFKGQQKQVQHEQPKDPYAFKMIEEMRFTDEEVIRLNITLGLTGDMFKSHGVFFTDFMQVENETSGVKSKSQIPIMHQEEESSENDEGMQEMKNEAVDPNPLIANSMKPRYLKRAINKDKILKNFNADIDNFPGVSNIENIIIAAMTDEDNYSRTVCKGVLQIFNKDKTKVLNPMLSSKDIRRIQGIQKLVGAAVTRVELYTKCLTTLLGLGMFLDASQMIGTKRNVIEEELQHCFYDVSKMVPSVDGIKRFLDHHYAEKITPVLATKYTQLIQSIDQSIEIDNSNSIENQLNN